MAGSEWQDVHMDNQSAKSLALAHMAYYNLSQDGWQFEWMDSFHRLGETTVTRTGKKLIRLSYQMTAIRSEDEVKKTIIHECAHAIAGIKAGHGPRWKAQMRAMGADPQRLAPMTDETRKLTQGKFKYSVVCPHNGDYLGGMSRKSTAKTYRYVCPCHRSPAQFIQNW